MPDRIIHLTSDATRFQDQMARVQIAFNEYANPSIVKARRSADEAIATSQARADRQRQAHRERMHSRDCWIAYTGMALGAIIALLIWWAL